METRNIDELFLRGTPCSILEAISNHKTCKSRVARYANATYSHTHLLIKILEMQGFVFILKSNKRDTIVNLTEKGERLLQLIRTIREIGRNV